MKVVCIKNEYDKNVLTLNKKYKVIREYDEFYVIIADDNIKWPYYKNYFKPLSEYRNEKINKLLGE